MTVLGDLGARRRGRIVGTADDAWTGDLPRLHVLAIEVDGTAARRRPGRRGCPTTPSSTTASSPSATCAPARSPGWRRARARCSGTSARAPARSRSSGCAPHPTTEAVAVEAEPERAARIARNAARLGVPRLRMRDRQRARGTGRARRPGRGLRRRRGHATGLLDLCRRRAAPGRPAGRARRHAGDRAAARVVVPAPRRRADPDRGRARRAAGRPLHRLDARAHRHPVDWRMDDPMTVHFVGAGPGAADLITLRAARLLADGGRRALPRHLPRRRGARPLPADDAAWSTPSGSTWTRSPRRWSRRTWRGLDVVRLTSGDPSLYSALHEQTRRLDAAGVPWEVTPGVPAYAAAAALVGSELTVPLVAQSVVLTRTQARSTAMPERRVARGVRGDRRDPGAAPGDHPHPRADGRARAASTAPTARSSSSTGRPSRARSCCAAPSAGSPTRSRPPDLRQAAVILVGPALAEARRGRVLALLNRKAAMTPSEDDAPSRSAPWSAPTGARRPGPDGARADPDDDLARGRRRAGARREGHREVDDRPGARGGAAADRRPPGAPGRAADRRHRGPGARLDRPRERARGGQGGVPARAARQGAPRHPLRRRGQPAPRPPGRPAARRGRDGPGRPSSATGSRSSTTPGSCWSGR